MPVIKPYQQQVFAEGLPGNRQASSADFGGAGLANLGQSIVSMGIDLSRANAINQRAQGQKEATDAAVYVSELHISASNELDADALAWKPGMDSVPTVTMRKVQEKLDAGAGKFITAEGQQTYHRQAAMMTAQLAEISGRVQSKLDGQAAALQREALIDNTGMYLQTHPDYARDKLAEIKEILGAPQGIYAKLGTLVQQKHVQEAQERVAINAVQGLIRMRPLSAEEILTNPELSKDPTYNWITAHIPQEKMNSLMEHARVMGALQISKQTELQKAVIKAQEIKEKASLGELTVAWISAQNKSDYNASQTKHTILEALQKIPDTVMAHPEMVRAMLSAIDADINDQKVKGEAPGDPFVYRRLFTKIADNKMPDMTELNTARGRGTLTAAQHQELVHEWQEARTPDGRNLIIEVNDLVKRAQPFIAPQSLTGVLKDPETGLNLLRFQRDVQAKITQYRKDGKDPHQLLDPNSPDYMGNPDAIMGKYVQPLLEQLRNRANKLSGADGAPKTSDGGVNSVNQRRPGETVKDFLTRQASQQKMEKQ